MGFTALWLPTFGTPSSGKVSVFWMSIVLTHSCALRVGYFFSPTTETPYGSFNAEIFWQGKSSKFAPHAQKVGLNHPVQDDDVVSSEPLVFDLR